MNHDPRPHIHRRRRAIGRLRSFTTGAAVAGFAGTAGFGILAAASWSGTPGAVGADGATTDGTTGITGSTGITGGTNGSSGITRIAPTRTPSTGGTALGPTVTTPRVQRVSGGGHASTGGSH